MRMMTLAVLCLALAGKALGDTPPARTVNSQTFDGAGNAISSSASGGKRPLDTAVVVSGAAIDPRARTWALGSGGDSVSVPGVSEGMDSVLLFRNVYTSVPVTTGAYVQVVASTSDQINRLLIFDSSGALLKLAVGASGLEVDKAFIFPGGTSAGIGLKIPAGSRISIRAVDANATVGQIAITGLK